MSKTIDKTEKRQYTYSYGNNSTDGVTHGYYGTELGVKMIAKRMCLRSLGHDYSNYYVYKAEGDDEKTRVYLRDLRS